MMNNRVAVILVITLLASLLSSCTPKPPEGAFPEKIAGLNRLYDVFSSKKDDYISHNTEYGHYLSENERQIDVFYELRVYPSAQKAEAALQEKSQGENNQAKHLYWEDRLNKSGQKLGKMLIVEPVRKDKGGQCAIIYTRDYYYVYIRDETTSCETAKKFQQELSS